MNTLFTRVLLFLLGGLTAASAAWAQCPTAACTPGRASDSNAPLVMGGIYQVQLGSNTYPGTGYAEGYRDSSCSRQGIATIAGGSFSIQVRTGSSVNENVRVYLDANNDGSFDSTGAELVFSSNRRQLHTGTITIPAAAVMSQRLRLRVATDAEISALPSPCRTPAYGQTKDFYVLALPNNTPPTANFTTADSVTCSGNVAFRDLSDGAPTGWLWRFGDGDSATVQNPTHFYAQSGTYSVTLIATNANGSDTITRPGIVRFNDSVPVPACTLTTTSYCCGYGVTRVQLIPVVPGDIPPGVIDHTSANGSAGYENFTCTVRGHVTEGRPYRLWLTTGTQPQAIRVWIDADGSGTFEASEVIYDAASVVNPMTTVTMPTATGAGLTHAVRMRIVADGVGSPIGACRNPQLGQAEDYTIILDRNTLPPYAEFTRVGGNNCDSTYTFTSSSGNAITSLIWLYGDGTTDTTVTSSVTHTYANPGTYTVSLIAIGPFGRDTATITNAVTYVSAPAPASCGNPATGNSFGNIGLTRVQFGTIDVTSGFASEGYRDFTCEGSTTIVSGRPTPITLTAGAQNAEQQRVWIDLNNDLTFDASELVLSTTPGNGTRTSSITLPSRTVLGVPLRVRIVSVAQQGGPAPNLQPCATTINFGQYEDYSVVVLANTQPPVAGFGAVSRTSCNGTISFVDSSLGATRFFFDFGDGNTDTVAAPTHTYANPGTYTVIQRVYNAFGADSLTRVSYVTILQDLNILPAPCAPVAANTFNGFGVGRFQFGTIDNTSGDASEGYKDFSCSHVTTAKLDTILALTVTPSAQNFQLMTVWIDYNSDGQFTANEIVATGNVQAGRPLTAQVRIPATATANRGLRVRVISDGNAAGGQLEPCTVRFGQAEDYTLLINAQPQAPSAQFRVVNGTGCSGLVSFRDSSLYSPTSRLWRFGDGATDTVANPTHQYAPGTYDVTLIVRNAQGVDSLVQTAVVSFQPLAGLTASTCLPSFRGTNVRAGIYELVVGNTTVVSLTGTAASGTYTDRTCDLPTIEVAYGDTIRVRAQTGMNDDSTVIFIDLDNDGDFDADERITKLIRTSLGGPQLGYTGKFVLPSRALSGVPLRLRVVLSSNPQAFVQTPTACGSMAFGQSYDLTVKALRTAPVAGFTYANVGCSFTMQFNETTTGGPEDYFWHFGDSSTDTVASPSHTYAQSGTYQVTLIVTNAIGADTLVQTVTVNDPSTPAICTPATQQQMSQLGQQGLIRVELTDPQGTFSIVKTSLSAIESYQDYSCTTIATREQAQVLRVRMNAPFAQGNPQRVYRVMLDGNNDGDFDDATEEMGRVQGAGTGTFQIDFMVPMTTAIGRLRLRVYCYLANSQAPTCTNVFDGQAEDYGLNVDQFQAARPSLADAFSLNLAPNPTAGNLRLTAELPSAAPATFRLVDATGRVVLTRTFTAQQIAETLSLHDLPTGVYQAVLTQDAHRSLHRVVVER